MTVKNPDYSEWFKFDELQNHDTISSKIRYLSGKGKTRGEISRILNIRYQHVRNVLITPTKK